ncbi:Metallo-hydrolase/oxidoreductase [Pholiota conissans]|uniref:Metallo-hydrolase/oxidoreductase n=1 Tax=Pholiota conissans TaxID=109636 RepID=A0A9P5Z9S4_9AGAR|nr:Metallo-hydrolase/oxidoreductase [Pholiota conissans]
MQQRNRGSILEPVESAKQSFCDVSALEAGHIALADEMFITNAVPGKVTTAPSLSYLIRHSDNGQTVVFDLGIRKDWENYPPIVVERVKKTYPVNIPQDAAESLVKGGISPSDITYVCLSHCHFDHIGDTRPFTNSIFLVGGACQSLFTPGYPADPKASFASDLLPAGRTTYFNTGDWKPIGPFPRSLDFFGDGSLYIIDAPGHLAGHINILARTSADGGWVYLAGDSAHHWNLVTLESAIATGHPGHVHNCAHENQELAEEHILRINALMKIPRVRVLLAHDEPFYSKNKDGPSFWPGKIPSL